MTLDNGKDWNIIDRSYKLQTHFFNTTVTLSIHLSKPSRHACSLRDYL